MAGTIESLTDLDELAEQFAERLRAGEHPSIEDYVAAHPAWGDELRAVLSGVAMLEKFKPQGSGGPRLPHFTKPPEKLGEFRIVRELGRGGMGVVYEAVQETLHRSVALKLLPGHWASSDKLRARFRREALAAARLHHSNIVPVFSVGEIDGFCYYAMQLIRGTSLDRLRPADASDTADERATPAGDEPAAFVERSTIVPPLVHLAESNPKEYVRRIVGIGVQAADALSYAHAHGVLHRDIKPSNLILDEAGTVWVSDFGVARIADEASLTQSGDVVGTMKYMPPERFAGTSDERGDVYSLGMTLYELLARQSAWPDTNPQRLMKLISDTDPQRLSKRHSHVGADLETVVMTAIARDPARRYASPREFADDLRRVLDDRPIHARRASLLDRTTRWCRRNPAVAAAAAVVMASMAAITAVSVAASIRTTDANARMEGALKGETEQREQAERISELSLAALNQTFREFAPTRLVVGPVTVVGDLELPPEPTALTPEAIPLLEQLLLTYEKIAATSASYPKLQAQAAEANHRIGDIQQRLGRSEEAEKAYRAADTLYSKLSGSEVENLLVIRARIANELGRVLRSINRLDDSIAQHHQAISFIALAPPRESHLPEYRYELAAANYCLGRRDMFLMGPAGPRGPHGHDDHGPGGKGRGGPPPGEHGLDPPPEGLGPGLRKGRGFERDGPLPNPAMQAAVVLLEALVRDYPEVAEYRHLLAGCHRESRGPGVERAIALLRELVKDFPRVPDYQYDLCETLSALGRPGQSREWVTEAVQRSEELMNRYPRMPDYAAAHGRHLDNLGWLDFRAGEYAKAEANFRKAVDIQRKVVEAYPAVVSYGIWLSLVERALAVTLMERGVMPEAVTLLAGATERVEMIFQKNPTLTGLRPFLGMALSDYATALEKSGMTAQAVAMREKARQFGGPRP